MQPLQPLALLIKQQVLVAHEAHYAGGIHLFSCLADSLAASGWRVTVVSHCSKQLLLLHAAQRGLLGRLRLLAAHGPVEIITWQAHNSLQHVAAVTAGDDADDNDSSGGSGRRLAGAAQALLLAVAAAALQLPLQHTCVILDVDALQHTEVPVGSSSSSSDTHCTHGSDSATHPATAAAAADGSTAPSDTAPNSRAAAAAAAHAQQPFLLALLQLLQQQQHRQQQQQGDAQPAAAGGGAPRVVGLVQNLHHMPFGPVGTAPRSAAVLQAWQQLHGLLCVSRFVAGYSEQHALPLLRLGSSSSSSRWQPDSSGQGSSSRVFVVHPAAVGAFGAGPFADLAAVAAERLWPAAGCGRGDSSTSGSSGGEQAASNAEQQQQQWAQPPVVVMLKLTKEKGSDLFFALAARLPSMRFLGVTGDDGSGVRGEHGTAATGELRHNVTLVPPAADVSALLAAAAAAVVVVPSVLLESFGLVAFEGQLRGLPVLVADAGALPEAAGGAAAAVLPVQLAQFPVAPAAPAAGGDSADAAAICSWVGGRRHWDSRQLLPAGEAVVDAWAAALQQVLGSHQAYAAASRRGKAAAHGVHGRAGELLQQLLAWNGGATHCCEDDRLTH